jgi:polyhydroxyalkanoate synthesis regulator phasin
VAERTPEEARERRQNLWLVILTVIALAAAGAAVYAISEVENTKDESRETANDAVNALRADVEVFREQLTERIDTLEGRVDDAADAETQRKLQADLDALDKRVKELDDQGSGGSDNLATRIDDLEQRVEDLEEESN